jgi:hypothetical protein
VQRATTLSVSIAAAPGDVYRFVSNAENLPAWAPAFCKSVVRSGDAWSVEAADGQRVTLRFAPDNPFGVLDHDVTLAPGAVVHVPMRVVSNGQGSELLFTLFRAAPTSDAEHGEDVRRVTADLLRLKSVLEGA